MGKSRGISPKQAVAFLEALENEDHREKPEQRANILHYPCREIRFGAGCFPKFLYKKLDGWLRMPTLSIITHEG